MNKPLEGKVALVTGATRGLGRGIALQLGEAGCTVYITGRAISVKSQQSADDIRSVEDIAKEIFIRGGKCICVQVDHEDDFQVSNLFQRISKEQNGQLDILVNNAFKGVQPSQENAKSKFWESKPEIWDDINNIGLRNHYYCTVYAARMMVARGEGLIVNISSYAGSRYIFNVAYGVGKCALDRMALDCAIELKSHNVAMISLYPGPLKTKSLNSSKFLDDLQQKSIIDNGESIEFCGKVIVSLAQDPDLMKFTSRVIIASEYAQAHNIRDVDGRTIYSHRQIKYLIRNSILPKQLKFISNFIPSFLRIPQFLFDIARTKFVY